MVAFRPRVRTWSVNESPGFAKLAEASAEEGGEEAVTLAAWSVAAR